MKKTSSEKSPNIVAFICHWSGYTVLEKQTRANSKENHYIRVMCSGRVSPGLILQAFELGADGVLVFGCREGSCHYSFGNTKAKENVKIARELIHILGIDDNRLRLELTSAEQATAIVAEFAEHIKRMH